MNDLLVHNHVLIPLADRASTVPFRSDFKGVRSNALDSEMWNIHEWYRETRQRPAEVIWRPPGDRSTRRFWQL